MPYTKPESRLLYEWMVENYPDKPQWRRVRLGPYPKGHEEPIYGIVRRWIDGVVEAKIRPDPGALSQLELYAKLFPKTPEFSMFKDKPLELVFLTTKTDPEVEALAKEKGIRYVVYRPKWVEEYIRELIIKKKKK